MPNRDDDAPVYLDEVHQDIAEFAARHLDEEEREDFVNGLLERHGYQQNTITTWEPPEPDPRTKRPLVKPAAQRQGQGGKPSYFGGKRS